MKKRLNEIYVKHTGQKYATIEKTLDRDFFMTADEAKVDSRFKPWSHIKYRSEAKCYRL